MAGKEDHVISSSPPASRSQCTLAFLSVLALDMSASSPITDPIPHSVAETLQVTTSSDATDPVSVTDHVSVTDPVSVTQPVPASSIPSVGASISVPDNGSAASALANDRSSSALLSLASSCSLTEILNAQQQALEQFQCQLQLAQQTEAINQRLDAIERTLNSLIQQRAQEEAAKNAAVVAAAAAAVTPLTPSQLRPSQQLQLPSSSPPGSNDIKKKLPRELCVSSTLRLAIIITLYIFNGLKYKFVIF